MALLLAALLTAQLLPAPRPTPPRAGGPAAQRRDLELDAAVEDFVRAAEPQHRPPEPYRGLIARLGSDCFVCRRIAGRRLRREIVERDAWSVERKDDPSSALRVQRSTLHGIRWLFWGRHDPDPEIRLRCNNLLQDLTRCGMCDGTGTCRRFVPERPEQQPDYGPCQNCGLWPWTHQESPGECWACSGRGSAWAKGALE